MEQKLKILDKIALWSLFLATVALFLDSHNLNYLISFTSVDFKFPVSSFYSKLSSFTGLFLLLLSIGVRVYELNLKDKIYTKLH